MPDFVVMENGTRTHCGITKNNKQTEPDKANKSEREQEQTKFIKTGMNNPWFN